jgi:transcriptional regulator with XRE-family HTH domain
VDSGESFSGYNPRGVVTQTRQEGLDAIARRLRLTREALSQTQSGFCALTGISRTAWNNYERALRRISIDEALKVVRVTGVSLDWIYRGVESALPLHLVERIRRAEADGADTRRKRR